MFGMITHPKNQHTKAKEDPRQFSTENKETKKL